MVRKRGIEMYTLLCFTWITNKDRVYSQETLLNVMCQPGWEGSLRENGYMYMYGCSLETITTLLILQYTPI